MWREGGEGDVGLELVAVHDDGFGTEREAVEGAVHGEDGGIEDVDMVYFLCRDYAYSPCEGITLYLLTEDIAFLLGELLGIIEHLIDVIVGQYDGSSEDGTNETTSSGFVASGFYLAFVVFVQEHFFWWRGIYPPVTRRTRGRIVGITGGIFQPRTAEKGGFGGGMPYFTKDQMMMPAVVETLSECLVPY